MKLEFIPGSKRARCMEPEIIQGTYTPPNFIFDGASIPTLLILLIWLTPWHPKMRKGARLHDYLWSIGEVDLGNYLFRRQIREDGCNPYQTWAAWAAVTLRGKLLWLFPLNEE